MSSATREDGTPDVLPEADSRASGTALAPGLPSFREIHDRYFGFVWRYAANRRVPPMAIDDVVQEVFLVVHHRLSSFEGRSSLKTWLAGIAHNVVRGYVRKPSNRATAQQYLDEELELLSPGASPAEMLERKAAVGLLHELLDKLSEAQRDVFILSELEQLSSIEIAEVIGVNENTVRTRLFAARKLFNQHAARAHAQQKWSER